MKKLFIILALMLTIGMGVSQAQTVTDSWAFGFGLSYPRYYSANITALNTNYGAYLSIQRNFSENVGLRLKGGYFHLEGEWSDASLNKVQETTNIITSDLDLMYYLVPCAPVTPYLFVGVGANYKMIADNPTKLSDNYTFGTQLNAGVGAEFKINSNWSFVSEFGYYKTNNSDLDGAIAPIEVNGRDSYMVLSAGLNFFFNQGVPSKKCEPCQKMPMEMKDMTDYNRIEDMIVKHIPKEVIVDKHIYAISEDRLVLVGVKFAFDKSDLLPESYSVLDKAVKLLKDNPDVKVEIEGYSDYIGSAEYNQKLSVERALTVKSYLVSKGIADSRLSTVGMEKKIRLQAMRLKKAEQ
ncbi:MAG: OmpA family protein [candidate division KSB1 bacterium]|nr:OmpA family protein [candidate division KSB1 bacterium]